MSSEPSRKQPQYLTIAAVYLGLYALILTLAPAARNRSWDVDYLWGHWAGFGVWLVGFAILQRLSERYLPDRDPYLLPIIAVLSGWGLLTIWRLAPGFGMRQTLWLAIALGVFWLGLRLPADLNFLRRYKYLWLTSGLLLTALTLILGTNPMGFGPRLWLGCCGVYLQPSEPLKLLLVVYLSAYFSDWMSAISLERSNVNRLNILTPTLIMTGLALLLLLVQRDLGTASIFIFLYSVMVYLATGWRWVPFLSGGTLVGAGLLGYAVFDVIRLRVDAWLNPWLDPAGRSYQIVQSLISVANGGILGRGPGLGSPGLVPVAHSDFVFAAIAEETGLLGVIGFLILLGLFVHRGFRIAIHTQEPFQRYLASGLTTFLAAQSILIIGGNLRLLPLTGVTLPFVSYGGSSLLVSFISVVLLLKISTIEKQYSAFNVQRSTFSPFTNISTLLLISLVATTLIAGWWTYVRGPALLTRTDNPRRSIADRFVERGNLLARDGTPLTATQGQPGEYARRVLAPSLSSVVGYNHPVYGQSGLEASLDPYLRGTQGYDALTIWWHHLLYGQPPPGLDIRLTLDLELQRAADELLQEHTGALILLNAETGEIIVMASHPTYDANTLDDQWDALIQDPHAPLINRVTQGSYPTGNLEGLLLNQIAANPEISPLSLRLPLAETAFPTEASPLEVALAAAALSHNGIRPAPRIARMVENPAGGWLLLPTLNDPVDVLSPSDTQTIIQQFAHETNTWQIVLTPADEDLTWYVSGSLPGANLPLALVVVLEDADAALTEAIGRELLAAAGSR